jgi:hypothetical protein
VRDSRHHVALRGGVAPQLVSHQSSRTVAQTFKQFAEESLRCTLATASLYKNIKYFPALIDRAPQVDELSVNLAEDFIEMPSITTRVAPSAQPPRVLCPELHRPEAYCFVRDHHAAGQHEL